MYHRFVATPSVGTFHFVKQTAPEVAGAFIDGMNRLGQ
jgi:hypothetical protein